MSTALDELPWKQTRQPGLSLFWIQRDEESGDATVLIRMEPGTGYPRHRHVGQEFVTVLQGGYRDEQGEYRVGSVRVHPPDSVHTPVALEGDDACILAAVAKKGIELVDA